MTSEDAVNNPSHYGGSDNTYEAIKVIEAWRLGFCLGNTVKYISRAGKKPGESELKDLKKARWYIDREIVRLEANKQCAQENSYLTHTVISAEPRYERCPACGFQNWVQGNTCRSCDAEL